VDCVEDIERSLERGATNWLLCEESREEVCDSEVGWTKDECGCKDVCWSNNARRGVGYCNACEEDARERRPRPLNPKRKVLILENVIIKGIGYAGNKAGRFLKAKEGNGLEPKLGPTSRPSKHRKRVARIMEEAAKKRINEKMGK